MIDMTGQPAKNLPQTVVTEFRLDFISDRQ
jgi:hypothetical protein